MSLRLVGLPPGVSTLVGAEPPDGLTAALVSSPRPSLAEIDTVMWYSCSIE